MSRTKMKRIVNYLLLITTILMVLSGYGITKYQIVNKISLGLIQKSNAFLIHSKLAAIFVVLMFAHVALSWRIFKK